MTIQEWFWLLDSALEKQEGSPAAPAKNAGGFSEAAWADARRRHAEKMA
ncbi:hypothetical protein [Herbaspirillum sp.]|nr:hypothetical protein [Herbaspirillum sp.]MCP3946318.1 hypothetical protein [Herbaspirillum sp.]